MMWRGLACRQGFFLGAGKGSWYFYNVPLPIPHDHEIRPRTGVLLVNLGTPASPERADVRRYLREFLSDRRVIELPRWVWQMILNLVILPFRTPRSAEAYAKVWYEEGAPLLVRSRQLTDAIAGQLPELEVDLAMRYGEPAMQGVIENLLSRGVQRLLVVPLYPQYSATTTASVFDELARSLSLQRWLPQLRFVSHYHDYPAWLDAVAASIRRYWQDHGRAERLLFSLHGIPERYFLAGDPYYCQCQASARGIAERLGLDEQEWLLSFQSRVGREPWLKPYTDISLKALAAQGVRRVQVVCPGFAVDCLETLEEIAMQNAEDFVAAGGEALEYIPALNEHPDHVAALVGLIQQQIAGWDDQETDLQDRAERAQRQAAAYPG